MSDDAPAVADPGPLQAPTGQQIAAAWTAYLAKADLSGMDEPERVYFLREEAEPFTRAVLGARTAADAAREASGEPEGVRVPREEEDFYADIRRAARGIH